jgi:uncharacterized protein YfkK (UPF0435 family)
MTEELEEEVNKAKSVILTHLLNNKQISSQVYNDMTRNYGIIIKKPSFFGSWWKSKKRKNVKQYVLVKQVSIPEVDDKEDTAPKLNVVKLDIKKDNGEPE